jgi:superfamily II DNA or RNA helicase
MTLDPHWFAGLQSRLENAVPWDDSRYYSLALRVDQVRHVPKDDVLHGLRHLAHVVPLPHQIETARRVIHEMHGRALLADEVGLGKTIEAGLILKEYLVRGLVTRALLLVPASLVMQWVRELRTKFAIDAVAHRHSAHVFTQANIVVASLDTAKRKAHESTILAQSYDLLLIDEAHKLKNERSINYAFVNKIQRTFCLLLTATPVHNNIRELYPLISLLKPGYVGTAKQFCEMYGTKKKQQKNHDTLRHLLAPLMVRNERTVCTEPATTRHVTHTIVDFSPEEQALYDGITTFMQQKEGAFNRLSLLTLQREACSSRDAVFVALVRMMPTLSPPLQEEMRHVLTLLRHVTVQSKATALLAQLRLTKEKTIVFTEYRATQHYLLHMLQQAGIVAVPYDGGMNRGKKSWMVERFQQDAHVLVATEAGGEGLNLQFCHHMINYDLPWNPMRVEQRIGRIHRLGQTSPVQITNFTTRGTIEEHLLSLLQEKITLFQDVIGDLQPILDENHVFTSLPTHAQYETSPIPPPPMSQEEIYTFAKHFAVASGCALIHDDDTVLTLGLSPYVDEHLLQRSYYWRYVRATGAEAKPLTVAFSFGNAPPPCAQTAPQAHVRETLTYGCTRLYQLFDLVQQHGRWICVYAEQDAQSCTPWLVVHGCVAYRSHVRYAQPFTWAYDLSEGTLETAGDEWLRTRTFVASCPATPFTPLHPQCVDQALAHIRQHLFNTLQGEDHTWATHARHRLAIAEQQLETVVHQDTEEETMAHVAQWRLHTAKGLHDQLAPHIEVSFLRGGLFYAQR